MPPLLGVVLAGGASRRMGRDKALLTYRGRGLAAWAAERLAAAGLEVVLADGGRDVAPPWPSVTDAAGRQGPVAGLLGAAAARRDRSLIVLACDLPLVPVALLAALAARLRGGADLVAVRSSGGLEPLVGGYGVRALARLATSPVTAGPRWLASQPGLRVDELAAVELVALGVAAEAFVNVNTCAEAAALGIAVDD